MSAAVPTALDRICGEKKKQVAEQKGRRNLQEMLKRAQDQAPPRGFLAGVEKSIAARGIALIAEIKKASPSAGVIRSVFEPTQLARGYQRGGAACLSVLTDQRFFQGSEADLGAARSACELPVLRKDFMIDPYQVVEARALGADCILLIVAALTDAELSQFEDIALGYQMDVLIEVHDEAELERALKLKSRMIGVNNRNLKTMRTDIATTERLAPLIPADRLLVSESGIASPVDVKRLADAGAKAFLIGEALLRRADVEMATKVLLTGFAAATTAH
jgi:indole-3-glycerol phosphate synthase